MITSFCKTITNSQWFPNFILFVIIGAGVLVGMETYPNMVTKYGAILHVLDKLIVGIFVLEVIIKILSEGDRPWNYFKDSWNIFDFAIVVISLSEFILPVNASIVMVLRLVRIVRVFRLITALPKLQILVGALLKSIPSMAYIGIFLSLLFYIYATMSVFLFGANDPWHFADLEISMVSLFRIVTLEDWTDIMYISMYGCDKYVGYPGPCNNPSASPVFGALFFISFVMIGTMIVLNLFIGVIMNSMNEMKAEKELEQKVKIKESGDTTINDDIHLIHYQLEDIKSDLDVIRARLKHISKGAKESKLPSQELKS